MRTGLVAGLAALALLAASCGDSGNSEVDNVESPTSTTTVVSPGSVAPTTTSGVFEIPTESASALRDVNHASFPEPLVDPNQIISGGPPPDGIPPIDNPQFLPIADVSYLADNEPVLVLEINGEARAYPVQIMTWHEIVNDELGGVPVTVTFCPLCNSAVAYERTQPDGTVLDFGTSGRLYNSSLVMYDRQTESLWTHFDGKAVVGTLTGLDLVRIPMATTSWLDFRTAYPEGDVLSIETGFARDYGRNPYAGYDDVDSQPFLFRGEVDGRLAAKTHVVAIRGDAESVVVTLEHLEAERVVPITFDGAELVVLWQPGTSSSLDQSAIAEGFDIGATGVFVPVFDGASVTLEADGADGFVDAETGSRWNIFGKAVDGALDGASLTPVEHLDTFWFAIAAFRPDSTIVGG